MEAIIPLQEEQRMLLLDDVFRTQDRRKKVYNYQEREKIEAYRQQYMSASNNREQKQVVCSILPALFNYWVDTGSRAVLKTEEFTQQEAKRLLQWIRNNWRPKKPTEAELTGHAKKRTTVLWHTRKEEVYKEIAAILGVESVTAGSPGIFENRMKAMGNILARMSDLELKQLDMEGKALASVEYTDEQKRARAEKHAFRKLDEAAKRDWAEMGLLNITFVTRVTESGQLAVRVHDNIANTLGVTSTSFEDQKSAEVTQMKRMLGIYVRSLLNARDRGKDGGLNEDSSCISALDQDAQGFPKLPLDFDADKFNKRQLETLMGLYFSQHYILATNGRSKHPSYDFIEKKQSTFIASQYLPRKLKISAPRNMSLGDIRLFLTHLRQRQETFEPSQVFCFQNVKKHQKGEEVIPTQYPDDVVRLEEPQRRPPAPRKSRKKGSKNSKAIGGTPQIPMGIEEIQGASQLLSFNDDDNINIDPQLLGNVGHPETTTTIRFPTIENSQNLQNNQQNTGLQTDQSGIYLSFSSALNHPIPTTTATPIPTLIPPIEGPQNPTIENPQNPQNNQQNTGLQTDQSGIYFSFSSALNHPIPTITATPIPTLIPPIEGPQNPQITGHQAGLLGVLPDHASGFRQNPTLHQQSDAEFNLASGSNTFNFDNPALEHLKTFVYPSTNSHTAGNVSNAPAGIMPQQNVQAQPRPRPRCQPTTPEEIAQAEENRVLLEEARNTERELLAARNTQQTTGIEAPQDPTPQLPSTKPKRKQRSEVEEALIVSGKRVRRVRERTS